MNTTEARSKTRDPLPWILVGAVLAPIIILILSFFYADPEIRKIPVLLFIPIVGAVAGWMVYAVNPLGKPRGWRKPILLFIGLLVYIMAVIFGFALTRLGAI